MPRAARTQSEADIYHVVARGVNQSLIFEDDADCKMFLKLLAAVFPEKHVELYSWCLMGNHFHLLIHSKLEDMSAAMKDLLSSYAVYFNTRHDRSGHLFQGRFRTEAIDSDSYLLTVVRYIHWNPVKAGLSRTCSYRWSSYNEFINDPVYCSTEWVLDVFGGIDEFQAFHNDEPGESENCLDMPQHKQRMGDSEAIAFVKTVLGMDALGSIGALPIEERNGVLRQMKQAGMSIRQVSRLTGIGKNIIERA